jgi:hypothetical protein
MHFGAARPPPGRSGGAIPHCSSTSERKLAAAPDPPPVGRSPPTIASSPLDLRDGGHRGCYAGSAEVATRLGRRRSPDPPLLRWGRSPRAWEGEEAAAGWGREAARGWVWEGQGLWLGWYVKWVGRWANSVLPSATVPRRMTNIPCRALCTLAHGKDLFHLYLFQPHN